MSRTTTARLKNAVRRLNFALEIVQHAKGEYIVAQIRTNHRVRWALQRDYASGPVAVTGYRPAGEILRHIEAMLDGIAAARGLPVPRGFYDGFIKRSPAGNSTSVGAATLRQCLARHEPASPECLRDEPAAPACDRCSAPFVAPISELESLSGLCEACERDEGGAPDRCPITGDEYGTPS